MRLTRYSHGDGAKPKHAKKGAPEYSLVESIYASERCVLGEEDPAHTFEVSFDQIYHNPRGLIYLSQVMLEPASYSDEKYKLFEAYQTAIHKDRSTSFSFKQFLVETPLIVSLLLLR